ncbi:hypothetical protein SPADD19_00321 [Streptococcus parasanguinis]|nr:hypothetical protein SPADD19_00321 [Streptococcus parasanguinis]
MHVSIKSYTIFFDYIERGWDKKILILGILYYKFLKSID